MSMAKSKAQYWLTPEGLTLLSGWAKEGLSDEQIANNMDIHPSTLYEYKKKHQEITESLKKNKDIADYEVENAMYKKCLGYNVKIIKHFKLKTTLYDETTGRKKSETEELVAGEDEIHVPADTTAQIIWLKNRQPKKWRDKQISNDTPEDNVTIVNDCGELNEDY